MGMQRGCLPLVNLPACNPQRRTVTELEIERWALPKWDLVMPACPDCRLWYREKAMPLGMSTAWPGGGGAVHKSCCLQALSPTLVPSVTHQETQGPVKRGAAWDQLAPSPTFGPYCNQTTPEKSLFPLDVFGRWGPPLVQPASHFLLDASLLQVMSLNHRVRKLFQLWFCCSLYKHAKKKGSV